MKLQWRDELSVGNNVIDSDHRYLIDLINLIQASLESKNKDDLKKLLEDLTRYSLVHFAREEKIADAAGYVRVNYLSRSHHELLSQLEKVKAEIDVIGEDWSAEKTAHFTGFLRDWLINHVIKEDLLMKPDLEKFSPNFDLH